MTYSSKIALVSETRESRYYVINNPSEWVVPVAALEAVIQYTTSEGVENPIAYVLHTLNQAELIHRSHRLKC